MPRGEIQEITFATLKRITLGCGRIGLRANQGAGQRIMVRPLFGEIGSLREPRFDDRNGGKVLVFGNGFGSECSQIQLRTLSFQLPPITIPFMPAPPVFLGIKHRGKGDQPGQPNQQTSSNANSWSRHSLVLFIRVHKIMLSKFRETTRFAVGWEIILTAGPRAIRTTGSSPEARGGFRAAKPE